AASRRLRIGGALGVRVVDQDGGEVRGARVGLGSTVRFVCGLGRRAASARVLVAEGRREVLRAHVGLGTAPFGGPWRVAVLVVEVRSEVLRAHVGLGTAPFGGPWRVAVLVVEVRSEVLRALLRTALR